MSYSRKQTKMDHKELELIANNIWAQMDKEIVDWRNSNITLGMLEGQLEILAAELNGRRAAQLRAYELLIDEVAKMRHSCVLSKLNADNKVEPIKLISQDSMAN